MVAATDNDMGTRPTTPWWHWVVGVLLLLWNSGGAYDYIMTRTENADYLAEIPQPLMDYYLAMPVLMDITWPLAVWGGMIGAILLLARSRWAVMAFLVSLVNMLINFGYMLFDGGMALQAEYMGAGMAYGFTGAIVVLAVFALWYAHKMRDRGILR